MTCRITGDDGTDVSFSVPGSKPGTDHDVLINRDTGDVSCNCWNCVGKKKGDNFWTLIHGDSLRFCKHMKILTDEIREILEL